MKTEKIENQDPDLEKIRHYKGTWKNFFDFWKKKGVEVDPYKGTILKYPTEKIYTGRKNVHQDFGTYDKAKKIQENMKPILTYDEFLAESIVTEAKFDKKKLLKAIENRDDATILVKGKEYIIYNPKNNNDDNTEMWGDKTIFALDQDGEEHEFKYSEIERFNESIVTEASAKVEAKEIFDELIKVNGEEIADMESQEAMTMLSRRGIRGGKANMIAKELLKLTAEI
mgnify:CR=1 FL=1